MYECAFSFPCIQLQQREAAVPVKIIFASWFQVQFAAHPQAVICSIYIF